MPRIKLADDQELNNLHDATLVDGVAGLGQWVTAAAKAPFSIVGVLPASLTTASVFVLAGYRSRCKVDVVLPPVICDVDSSSEPHVPFAERILKKVLQTQAPDQAVRSVVDEDRLTSFEDVMLLHPKDSRALPYKSRRSHVGL